MHSSARPNTPKQHHAGRDGALTTETLDTGTVSRLRRDGAGLSTRPHRLDEAPTCRLDKVVDHVVILHLVIGGGQRHVEPLPVEHQAER